jgi:hypothetical protein
LQKIKANGDFAEYCLVEHLEFEQFLTKQISINSPTPPPLPLSNPPTNTSNSTSNLNVSAAAIGGHRHHHTTTSSSVNNKKLIVKTRILGPNENLFILTHVWNKMREDKKDGFKYAKIKLTKRKNMIALHDTSSLKMQSSLARHRMSLQPITTASSSVSRVSHISSGVDSLTTSGRPVAQRAYVALTQKRGKSSLHRLVRQKSFEENLEHSAEAAKLIAKTAAATSVTTDMDLLGPAAVMTSKDCNQATTSTAVVDDDPVAYTTTVTTTTMTTNDLVDSMERRMSGKKVTEVVESTVPLSPAEVVLVQKSASGKCGDGLQNDEPDDGDNNDGLYDDGDKEDYQLIQSEVAACKKKAQPGRCNSDSENIGKELLSAGGKKPPQRTNTVQRFFKLKF